MRDGLCLQPCPTPTAPQRQSTTIDPPAQTYPKPKMIGRCGRIAVASEGRQPDRRETKVEDRFGARKAPFSYGPATVTVWEFFPAFSASSRHDLAIVTHDSRAD
jgi:hypothetical protein